MEAATQPMYDAIAKLSENGEPLLGDAQVILGDGTTKVIFKHGRARVTATEAEMLQHRGDVDIPGYVAGTPSPEPVEKKSGGITVNQDGTINIRDLPPEMRQQLREELGIDPVEREAIKPPPADPEALKAAQEYLEQEGEAVPEPEAPAPEVQKTMFIPEGFEARTAEGESRCIARKSDGSQCANAAKGDTLACGLKKHQESVLAD